MLKQKQNTHFKTMLSATAVALALSAAPALAQSGAGQTGYIATQNSADARMGGQMHQDRQMYQNRTSSRTSYGTGTTASARGGEIITRTGQQPYATTTVQTREQQLMNQRGYRYPQTTTTYQQRRTTTGTPTQRYTPERLSEIETSVGSTVTTIDRTSAATRDSLYRNIEEPDIRIDQRLSRALSEPAFNRQRVTTETQTTTYMNR